VHSLMHTTNPPYKALHRPAIPLRSIAAAELVHVCWGGGFNKYHGFAGDALPHSFVPRSHFRARLMPNDARLAYNLLH
jgi:hypothetical protein